MSPETMQAFFCIAFLAETDQAMTRLNHLGLSKKSLPDRKLESGNVEHTEDIGPEIRLLRPRAT